MIIARKDLLIVMKDVAIPKVMEDRLVRYMKLINTPKSAELEMPCKKIDLF